MSISARVVEIDTGYRPRAWQRTVHENLKRFSVLVVHRRAGKTVLAANTLIDAACRLTLPAGRYGYVAPLHKQAKDVAWQYLKQYTAPIPGVTVLEGETTVLLPNGARLRIYGADDPDSLRGPYWDGIVLDEYADMKPEVFDLVIRPALADRKGWALFLGTPRGMDAFAMAYFRALKDNAWYAQLFTVDDTGVLDPVELAEARSVMSERAYRQEFFCDFTAGDADVLVPLEIARAAADRVYLPSVYSTAARVLGVDVARFGNDRSVLFPRQGLCAFKPRIYVGLRTNDLGSRAIEMFARWKGHALFVDSTGVGAGVVDHILGLHHRCQGIEFGAKAVSLPGEPSFQNRRSQMWWRMAEWMKVGAIPNSESLLVDLCTPKFWYDSAGRFCLESKEDITDRGMPSPDEGDALALTFSEMVPPPDDMVSPAFTGERELNVSAIEKYEERRRRSRRR